MIGNWAEEEFDIIESLCSWVMRQWDEASMAVALWDNEGGAVAKEET